MRNRRQGSLAPNGGETLTLQQIMDTMQALPTKEAPNQGACEGERATKVQLRGRVKRPHRYPQHSGEAEDTLQN